MSTPDLIADLDARVVKRVLPFAAAHDPRAALCGVHALPGSREGNKAARVEATNGHLLYSEEDKSAVLTQPVVIRISRRGHGLLKEGHRVKVSSDSVVRITDSHGGVLYIEPGVGILAGQFPNITTLVGMPSDWHEGLRATVNTAYLQQALSLPGYVRFFSRKDEHGQFSASSSVMFVLDGGTPTGGKAMGLIMPARGRFDIGATVADMLPDSLVTTRAVAARAA